MPKRKKEDRWRRKLKKYEDKLKSNHNKRSRVIIYSSEEEENETPPETGPYEIFHPIEEELLSTPIIPSTENCPESTPDVDPELLQTLGDFVTDPVEWGEDLIEEVAKRFQFILLNGLKKEAKEEFAKKYLIPKNIPLGKAPLLNPELSITLSDNYKNRDKSIQGRQDQLGRALTALGRAMTALLMKNPNIQEVVRSLNDCSQLIADSHYTETYTRRSLVLPLVDKSLVDSLKERKRDEYLFGNNLSDMVKNTRGIKNTGNIIQSSLNWNGPPSRQRPTRSYYQYQSSRGGRQRTQYTKPRRFVQPNVPSEYAQRRAFLPQARPPPPPPPPARRQTYAQTSRRLPAHTTR